MVLRVAHLTTDHHATGVFVFFVVPETKGRTLAEIQRMLGSTVTGLRPAASVPGAPVSAPFSEPAASGSAAPPTPSRSKRGPGPLAGQGSGEVASPREDLQGGIGAWWRRTTRAMQRGLVQSAPRVVLRRRFDRMEDGVVPQA